MTMARLIFVITLCVALDAAVGKHIYISTTKKWTDAQTHCRTSYVELSFVGSRSDQDQIEEASGETIGGWIGLYLSPSDKVWRWSGGGAMTFTNWAIGQPDNGRNGTETKAEIRYDGQWNDVHEDSILPFYCFSIDIEPVKLSWEGALKYCQNTSLISMTSETERIIIQAVVRKRQLDRVWMGLRYLGDRWLWMNGEPLEYNAWPGQDHQCPAVKRCGALSIDKLLETRDCREENYFICQ